MIHSLQLQLTSVIRSECDRIKSLVMPDMLLTMFKCYMFTSVTGTTQKLQARLQSRVHGSWCTCNMHHYCFLTKRGFVVQICILEGKAYSELNPETATDEEIDACVHLTNNHGKELLAPGKGSEYSEDKKIVTRFVNGKVCPQGTYASGLSTYPVQSTLVKTRYYVCHWLTILGRNTLLRTKTIYRANPYINLRNSASVEVSCCSCLPQKETYGGSVNGGPTCFSIDNWECRLGGRLTNCWKEIGCKGTVRNHIITCSKKNVCLNY